MKTKKQVIKESNDMNKKGDYNPSEQDMKDAWIIWYIVKYLVIDMLNKQEDIGEMFKTFELGLREIFDKPYAEGSPGEEIMKRLYLSWEQKSKWADGVIKQMKKGKADIYTAYSQAVIQTVFSTVPIKDEKKFYAERNKDVKVLLKRIKEWNKAIENQNNFTN